MTTLNKMLSWMEYGYDHKRIPLEFHPFQREAIESLKSQSGKVKLSIFYPSHFPDLPLALLIDFINELFDKEESAILIVGDDISEYREVYSNTLINSVNLCDLWGLAAVGMQGRLKSIRIHNPKLQTKTDRVYMSGNWRYFPYTTTKIGAMILIAPITRFQEKMDNALKWAEMEGIQKIVVVEPTQKVDRINYYKKNAFSLFGWTKEQVRKVLAANSIPTMSPYASSLTDFRNCIKESERKHTMLKFDTADKSLKELREIATKIKQSTAYTDSYGRAIKQCLGRFVRRVETLTSPIELDEALYRGTPFSFTTRMILEQMSQFNAEGNTSDFFRANGCFSCPRAFIMLSLCSFDPQHTINNFLFPPIAH